MVATGKRPARGVAGVRSAPAGLTGKGSDVDARREAAEARVWLHLVVVHPPSLEFGPGSGRDLKRVSFTRSSLRLPLKPLLQPFCWGFPGTI